MNTFIRFPNGLSKAFTLSYDDGARQDKRFVELINKYGLKATFNLNSGIFSKEREDDPAKQTGRMSEEEMKGLYDGHEVAVHTLTHPHLEHLPSSLVVHEVMQDRLNLERIFGGIVRGMAYPFGTYNDEVVKALGECGILYSRTIVSTGRFDVPVDWLRMPATCHHADSNVFTFIDKFLGENNEMTPWLFYMWGHTKEFDKNIDHNSWAHMEEIAKKVSGKDDVWYATNIEIYNYVTAFNRLEWSANGSVVHNPSNVDVWFACSPDKTVCVKAGQTLEL